MHKFAFRIIGHTARQDKLFTSSNIKFLISWLIKVSHDSRNQNQQQSIAEIRPLSECLLGRCQNTEIYEA